MEDVDKKSYNLRMNLEAYEDVLPKIPGNTMTAKIRNLIAYYEKMELGGIYINGEYGKAKWNNELARKYKEMANEFYAKAGADAVEFFAEELEA